VHRSGRLSLQCKADERHIVSVPPLDRAALPPDNGATPKVRKPPSGSQSPTRIKPLCGCVGFLLTDLLAAVGRTTDIVGNPLGSSSSVLTCCRCAVSRLNALLSGRRSMSRTMGMFTAGPLRSCWPTSLSSTPSRWKPGHQDDEPLPGVYWRRFWPVCSTRSVRWPGLPEFTLRLSTATEY
jgi:hypothetical protein